MQNQCRPDKRYGSFRDLRPHALTLCEEIEIVLAKPISWPAVPVLELSDTATGTSTVQKHFKRGETPLRWVLEDKPMYVLLFLSSVTRIFVVVLMRNRKRAFVSSELAVSGIKMKSNLRGNGRCRSMKWPIVILQVSHFSFRLH